MKARDREGFTLFEVLIALAVTAIAAAAALGGILSVMRFSERMNQRTEEAARLEEIFFRIERGEFGNDVEIAGDSEIRVHARGGLDGALYLRPDDDGAFRGFDVRIDGE